MRTERRWKWLSVVLTVLLGFAVAIPSAVADSSQSLHQMVEDVLGITTSMQRDTDATQQKVSALPADPASTTDITEAKDFLFDAVGKRGFSENEVKFYQLGSADTCAVAVPVAPPGTARLATITLIGVETNRQWDQHDYNDGPMTARVRRTGDADDWAVDTLKLEDDQAVTFIATAPEGAEIAVCLEDVESFGAEMKVRAQWDDRPMVHVDE